MTREPVHTSNKPVGPKDDWRRYEQQIVAQLRSKFPDADVAGDQRIRGKLSKARRQVDIAVRGKLAGRDVLGIVECKCFSRKVDVKDVDALVGFVLDVGANLGIMITNIGYSKAAQNRARAAGLHLDVVEFENLGSYEAPWQECGLCKEVDEHRPTSIIWNARPEMDDSPDVGHCDCCGGVSVRCRFCGAVQAIAEGEYDTDLLCEGWCGAIFRLVPQHIDKDMFEYCAEVARSPHQIAGTGRTGRDFDG